MAVAVVGSQVLFAGGQTSSVDASATDAVDLYDDSTGEWSSTTLSAPRTRVRAAVVGTHVLLAGGVDPRAMNSPVVDIYDSVSGTWSTDTLPRVRVLSIVATFDSTVVFVGNPYAYAGGRPSGPAVADVYDDASGQWTSTDGPGVGSSGLVGAAVGSQLLVSGSDLECGARGYQGCSLMPTGAVAIYDADSQRWSNASLSQPRSGFSAVAAGTQVLFAGGKSAVPPNAPSDIVDVYDAATSHWTITHLPHAEAVAVGSVSSSTDPRAGAWRTQAIFLTSPMTATSSPTGGQAASLDFFDAATGRWLSRFVPRTHSSPAVAVIDSRVLLVSNRLSPPSDSVDIFDLAADTWSAATLTAPRLGPTVVSVGSRMLIAGGLQAISADAPASDVVDLLDWSSDTPS